MTLFVIGKPIKHSLSPLIHNYWINKYQLGLEYKKMEVGEGITPFINRKRKRRKNYRTKYNLTL